MIRAYIPPQRRPLTEGDGRGVWWVENNGDRQYSLWYAFKSKFGAPSYITSNNSHSGATFIPANWHIETWCRINE